MTVRNHVITNKKVFSYDILTLIIIYIIINIIYISYAMYILTLICLHMY